MIVIPAIDLMGGKCVRLVRGRKQNIISYPDGPLAVAEEYASAGAKRIHVVDLDGAFTGKMMNLAIIAQLAKKFSIEVGGGVRSESQIDELLELGAEKIVVSTLLIKNPKSAERLKEKYYGKLIGSFDFKQGKLSYGGWVEQTELEFEKIAGGLAEIIVTDTQKDGTFEGPNLELLRNIKKSTKSKVIAAGGVAKIEDLIGLKDARIDGAIIGRALLEGRFSLGQAFRLGE